LRKVIKGGFMMTGDKFRALRHFLGLTQAEYASALGLSLAAIGRIETGSLQASPRVKAKLARLEYDEQAFFAFYNKMSRLS
jgi:transcriptional regulator with XRE-family HTH domain